MTEAQYAAALAASAAATRRALSAHETRMSAGIASNRVKVPLITAVRADIAAHPDAAAQQISERTRYSLRSVQLALTDLLAQGVVTARLCNSRRVFRAREQAND